MPGQARPARAAPTTPLVAVRDRRTVTSSAASSRNDCASSQALHGAESHTRARGAAPEVAVTSDVPRPKARRSDGATRNSEPVTASSTPAAMKPTWWDWLIRTRRGRSCSTRSGWADGVGSPGAGMFGSGNRASVAESCAACTVTSRPTTISRQPIFVGLSCQSGGRARSQQDADPYGRRRGEQADGAGPGGEADDRPGRHAAAPSRICGARIRRVRPA